MHLRPAGIRPKRSPFQGSSDVGRCRRRPARAHRGRRPPGSVRSRGASGGGYIALYHTSHYPDEVAGVVLLDVARDDPKEGATLFPGAQAWRNPEHLDIVDAMRRVLRLPPLAFDDIALRVVTAAEGPSNAEENQSYWLKLSSDALQTTLAGGHDLVEENTKDVVAEIRKLLDAIED